jgi:hypothetical protein
MVLFYGYNCTLITGLKVKPAKTKSASTQDDLTGFCFSVPPTVSENLSHILYLALPFTAETSWNVMAHTQKSDLVFRRNGRVHLNRRGRQFSRLLAAEMCASAVVMLDTPSSEVVWRVLATHSIRQFPLHFLYRASPCAITFQLESNSLLIVNGRVHLNRRGRQFSRLLTTEVCASAVGMLDTPCSEVVWRVLATHSIRQFPLHFLSRASPCAITFHTQSTYIGNTTSLFGKSRVLSNVPAISFDLQHY